MGISVKSVLRAFKWQQSTWRLHSCFQELLYAFRTDEDIKFHRGKQSKNAFWQTLKNLAQLFSCTLFPSWSSLWRHLIIIPVHFGGLSKWSLKKMLGSLIIRVCSPFYWAWLRSSSLCSVASLNYKTDFIGLGMVKEGTKCGANKVRSSADVFLKAMRY